MHALVDRWRRLRQELKREKGRVQFHREQVQRIAQQIADTEREAQAHGLALMPALPGVGEIHGRRTGS